MMALKLSNNASSTLSSAIGTGDIQLTVQIADASKFPTPAAGDWFPVTVVDGAGNMEIMRCTARNGAVLTVTRAQEGTTAKAFNAGARADIRLTAAAIMAFQDAQTFGGQLPAYYTDIVARLGFKPVQSGTGDNQLPNVLKFGWDGAQYIRVQVDDLDFGNEWPIIAAEAQDSDKLGGQDPAYYTDIVSRLGYTPFNIAGGALTGPLYLNDVSHDGFEAGNGDSASYTVYNVKVKGWNGWGFATYDGSVHGYYDFRAGKWDTKAGYYVNGAKAYMDADGNVYASGEFISSALNSYRHADGIYGTFWRQDGTNLYLMLTNANDPNGAYNDFRPLRVELATGLIELGAGATVAGAPILTGGGANQGTNVVKIGWGTGGLRLRVQVDQTDFGNVWPININCSDVVGFSTGQVGTYAFLRNNDGAAYGPGSTAAGSVLQYSNQAEQTTGTAAGTWLCMGTNGGGDNATVWVRIA